MSYIMDKLKKIETTVKNEPRRSGLTPSISVKTVNSSATRSGSKLVITLIAVVAFGILGYIAGTSSRKGDVGKPEKPSDAITVAQTQNHPISVPIDPDVMVEKPAENVAAVVPDVTVAETSEDLSVPGPYVLAKKTDRDTPVAASEDKEKILSKPPLAKKDIDAIAPETHPAAQQKHLVCEKYGKSGSMVGGDRVTALASAIIEATDEPITEEEEMLNKKTIQKLKVLGVVKEENEMVAIVSGQEVKEGDKIRQFTVEKITEDYLLLSFKRTFYRKRVQ